MSLDEQIRTLQKDYEQYYKYTVIDNYGRISFESVLDAYNTYNRYLNTLNVLKRPYHCDPEIHRRIKETFKKDIEPRLTNYME